MRTHEVGGVSTHAVAQSLHNVCEYTQCSATQRFHRLCILYLVYERVRLAFFNGLPSVITVRLAPDLTPGRLKGW